MATRLPIRIGAHGVGRRSHAAVLLAKRMASLTGMANANFVGGFCRRISAQRFAAVGSVENLHGVQNRNSSTEYDPGKVGFDLRHAADVARRDDVRFGRDDGSRFLITEFSGGFGLLDVVGSG